MSTLTQSLHTFLTNLGVKATRNGESLMVDRTSMVNRYPILGENEAYDETLFVCRCEFRKHYLRWTHRTDDWMMLEITEATAKGVK